MTEVTEVSDKDKQVVSEIQQRIAQLNSLLPEDMKNEMSNLKRVILDNPSACLLLLPEDIGQMVEALQKITGKALQESVSTKEKKAAAPKQKKLSAAELAAAMEDEDF